MIKIFSLPSHQTKERTSGVDWTRVIQPARELAKQEGFKVHSYDIIKDASLSWDKVAEQNDIVFFNYTASPWEFAKMGAMVRKNNKKLVLDLDDNLWHIQPDNPAYEAFKPDSENIRNFTAICKEVDYITTTNKYLRNVISHYSLKPTSKIAVLPNYLDLDNIYTYRKDTTPGHQVRIVHFGSTTHFADLQTQEFEEGMDRIMKDYPNVVFKTIGAMIPKYKRMWGRRYENDFGHQDVFEWIKGKFVESMKDCDIFVTPLADNKYTRCKSSIKFLEVSSAKVPGVWQGIRQYEEVIDGKNGLLAYSADHWYENIKKLVDDETLRRNMGEAAFLTVKNNWQMKNNVSKYCDFFSSIV